MSLHGVDLALPAGTEVLPQFFEFTVVSRPFASALSDATGDLCLSYRQLNAKANKLARCLLRHILNDKCSNPDGDRVVAVCMAPSPTLVIALLAIHKAGAAYLPLDVGFPASRVNHILADSRPGLVLANGKPANLLGAAENNVSVLHFEDLSQEVENENGANLSVGEVGFELSGSSIATILYTSGSTGIPKGVRVSHCAVLNRLNWQWETFPYQKDEVCCFKTALTFVDSLSEVFGSLLTGHKLVVIPKTMTVAVDEFVSVLTRERVGRLVLVPSLLRSILLYCRSPAAPKLPLLKLWVCSGEVFPPDLLQSFFEIFNNGQTICNFYGSTEVMGDVTYIQFRNAQEARSNLLQGKVPIGSPIGNCRIYLTDSNGSSLVAPGQMGEVLAAGLNVASGYVGGAQQDKFIKNIHTSDSGYGSLYRTGDYARAVDGVLLYEGRTDSQVKVRGHRIDLNEVQAAVQKVQGVDKCYVLVYKAGEINQALVAFYTSQDDELPPEYLKVQVALLLAPYMQPQLISVPELPLLVNGKVDRQKLLKMYESISEQSQSQGAASVDLTGVPNNQRAMAEVLLTTVGRILGHALQSKNLSCANGFFQIGGTSLNAVLTVTSLRDLGYHIGMGEFLKAETLGEVLKKLKQVKIGSDDDAKTCHIDVKDDSYTCHHLNNTHKDIVLRMVCDSFVNKGDLEVLIGATEQDYQSLMNIIYPELVKQDLSFIVCRGNSGDVVACSLNFDLYAEPVVDPPSKGLAYVFDFLEDVESLVRGRLPEGVGKVVHSFMMATEKNVGAAENVELIQIMEKENLKMAKEKNFEAVFTTNTSELTQHVCDDLLNYTVLSSNQVKLWTALDTTQPFKNAPDSMNAVSTVKFISEI